MTENISPSSSIEKHQRFVLNDILLKFEDFFFDIRSHIDDLFFTRHWSFRLFAFSSMDVQPLDLSKASTKIPFTIEYLTSDHSTQRAKPLKQMENHRLTINPRVELVNGGHGIKNPLFDRATEALQNQYGKKVKKIFFLSIFQCFFFQQISIETEMIFFVVSAVKHLNYNVCSIDIWRITVNSNVIYARSAAKVSTIRSIWNVTQELTQVKNS